MSERIVMFVAADLVLSACVVLFVLRRRKPIRAIPAGSAPGIVNLAGVRALAAFAQSQHERIGVFMRMNWNGTNELLPGVLGSLLGQLETDAGALGLPADRNAMKSLLATSLRAHQVASGTVVREALAKVA